MQEPTYTEDELIEQARRAGLVREVKSSWREVDLEPILAGEEPEPPPTMLTRSDGAGLLYAGRVHAIYGEPESGKSWFALAACTEAMRRDEHVLYIDFEDSPGSIVKRLRDLGMADDLIRSRFHYLRPDEPLDKRGRGGLDAVLAHRPTIAVVDGITEVMTLHGLNPEFGGDVAKFNERVVRPISSTGCSVITVDHVTKSKDTRGRWAIGSQHKLAGIDGAAYSFEMLRPFGRGRVGVSRIEVTKDRLGFVRAAAVGGKTAGELHLRSADDGTVVAEIRPTQAKADADALSPSRQWVLDALPEDALDAVTVQQIGDVTAERGHPLKRSTIQKALGELRERGLVDNLPSSEQGPSLWWRG